MEKYNNLSNIPENQDALSLNPEVLFNEIEAKKKEISVALGIDGEQLEKVVDDYILEKTKDTITTAEADGIITPQEQQEIKHDVGIVIVRSIDKASDGSVDVPASKLVQDGFEPVLSATAEQFGKQERKGVGIKQFVSEVIKSAHRHRYEGAVHRAQKLAHSSDSRDRQRLDTLLARGKVDLRDERVQQLYLRSIGDKIQSDQQHNYDGTFSIDRAIIQGVPIEAIASDERISGALVDNFIKNAEQQLSAEKTQDLLRLSSDNKPSLNYGFPLRNIQDLFLKILENPQYIEQIREQVDIQKYGEQALLEAMRYELTDDSFLDEKNLQKRKELSRNIATLRKLGFEPLSDEESFDKLFTHYYAGSLQRNLDALGLIEPATVDRMYSHKFDQLKSWAKKYGGEHLNNWSMLEHEVVPDLLIIGQLQPTEQNDMANYWRDQSAELGEDAMKLIMKYVALNAGRHDIFSELSDEEALEKHIWAYVDQHQYQKEAPEEERQMIYDREKLYHDTKDEQRWRLFSPDGMPTGALFGDQLGLPLHKIKHSFFDDHNVDDYYDEKIMKFFTQNLDMITGEDKGFIKMWGELDDGSEGIRDKRLAFMKWSTGGRRIQEHFFDENGATENFYRSALKHKNGHELLSKISPNWQKHFAKNEIQYMQFYGRSGTLDLNELYADSLMTDRYYHSERDAAIEKIEMINTFFDENGATPDLAKCLFSSRKADNLTILIANQELRGMLGDNERRYLGFLQKQSKNRVNPNMPNESPQFIKVPDFLLKIPNENLDEYFDENGAKPALWQLEFNNGELRFIAEQDEDVRSKMELSDRQQKVIETFNNIGGDKALERIYTEFILENLNNLVDERLDQAPTLLDRISKSNASEMSEHRVALARQLLHDDDPIGELGKIEDIFLRNNLPFVGKAYSVFNILHPSKRLAQDFGIEYSNSISPVLKNAPTGSIHSVLEGRDAVIFSDLLRCSFGSNNRSMRAWLESIRQGQELIDRLGSGNKSWDELSLKEHQTLSTFANHLNTAYSKTQEGQQNRRERKGDIKEEIADLTALFKPTEQYTLPDRIVRNFAFPMGIHNFSEAVSYTERKISEADDRNRETARHGIVLEQGDFVKGIGGVEYLSNILQNGSVAREFLGDSAGSDGTPLDTDLSKVLSSPESLSAGIGGTAANNYGPIYFILKNNERFATTRRSSAEGDSPVDDGRDKTKLEVFHTGVLGDGHYGVRTGFASSEIDAIVTSSPDSRVGLEIARNGFYIPVVDKDSGKVVFTPNDYDDLRSKMAGLSYYNINTYQLAPNLSTAGVEQLASQIEPNERDTAKKREAINTAMREALADVGLVLKEYMDGDLTPGSIELLDTGSTGRGTNMPGDGDFDFIMRVDKNVFLSPTKMSEIQQRLSEKFGGGTIGTGDFRLKGVQIVGLEQLVDIDISFTVKTNKLEYSSEQSLRDRLETIRRQSPEQYTQVIANILLAKKILKEAGAYKPSRGYTPQGGLGGIGIENWVLQNGGSFKTASQDFLATAEGKTFEEFKDAYRVWDFGENHLASCQGDYPRDNFVTRNMSAEGFEKMKKALQKYLS